MDNSICPTSESDDSQRFLIIPEVIQFIDFKGLPALRILCKSIRDVIDKDPKQLGYWRAVCNSYCYYAGLYSHTCADRLLAVDYKRHFFNSLWTIRDKWNSEGNEVGQTSQEYKIKVANRFRPGTLQSDKVCVPLHQFLKVKRSQRAEQAKDTESNSSILVGEQDPEEFVDPLLGTLMKEPVLLTSSGRVVDRSVAVQCVVRGGRDPFNNERLTMAMLVSQEELAKRIQEFRVKKQQRDVSLGLDELKPLVDDANAVNADLLEALQEVERINQAARKAEADARMEVLGNTESDIHIGQDAMGGAPETVDDPAAGEVPPAPVETAAEQVQDDAHLQHQHAAEMAVLSATDYDGHYNSISKKVERAGIVEINDASATVSMHVPGVGVRPYHYSAVHKGSATQQAVYERSAQEAVAAALNGFNSCVMCYGQTGSGKTYTFFGPEDAAFHDAQKNTKRAQQRGMVLRACEELLQARDLLALNGISVTYSAQFVEIYEEQVTDLLTGQTASIRRETGQVAGAVEAPFNSMEQVVEALRSGHERKRFAATEMNERSSRSHTALIIHVTQKLSPERLAQGSTHDSTGRCRALLECAEAGGDRLIRSQLHLIDLAGSERVKKSRVEGQRLREAVGINSSLLVLGKVIAALVQGKSHVPYFESKLTTLLKAAFGGNSRTTVIVNCRMDGDSGDETLQSMRFGERCAMISNSMRIAASSFQSALGAVDAALGTVREQLTSLEARGKQHLPSYRSLLLSFQALDRKRAELAGIDGSAASSA